MVISDERIERTIGVVSDIHDIGELLEGATLDEARCEPRAGRMELVLELTRAMRERQVTVRQGLRRRIKTPWTKCRLTLSGINRVAVKRLTDLAPDQTPLVSCDAVPGGYQVLVRDADGLQLVLGMATLQGQFSDVGSPIESP